MDIPTPCYPWMPLAGKKCIRRPLRPPRHSQVTRCKSMFLSTENTIFQGHHLHHAGLSYHHNLGMLRTSRLTCVCSFTNPLASCRLVFLKVNISSAELFVCRWQAANTFAGFNRELLRSFGINHFELQLCHRVENGKPAPF